MQILLVEDDDNKRSRVLEFLKSEFKKSKIDFECSLVSGLRAAKTILPDIVVLDMTLPNYSTPTNSDTNRMHAFGGVEFLRQMARLRNRAKIVVLTQFESFGDPPHVTVLEDLDGKLMTSYPEQYLGAVYYHATSNSWKGSLRQIMKLYIENINENSDSRR